MSWIICQNMKNFLDLPATNPEIQVWMMLEPIIANGPPYVRVYINGRLVHCDYMIEGTIIMNKVPLLDPVDIRVEMSGKLYSETLETAVVIKEFTLDEIKIVPTYTHLVSYMNDHNCTDPTSYLGFNGSWEFKTDCPFYQWLHLVSGQGWLLTP